MSEKLLPCPFCGSTDLIDRDFHYEDDGYYEIGCKSCNGARELFCGVHAEDRAEAVRQWNTRAPHSPASAPSSPEARAEHVVRLTYTNYRGETDERAIIPRSIRFGSTEWHPEPQWLLLAFDAGKNADREFALKDFGQPSRSAAIAAEPVSIDLMQRVWFNLYFDEEEAGNTFQHTLNEVVDWLAAHNALPDEAAPTTSPEPPRATAMTAEPAAYRWRFMSRGEWSNWVMLSLEAHADHMNFSGEAVKDGRHQIEPLYAAPPSSGNADAVREQSARIINPAIFEKFDAHAAAGDRAANGTLWAEVLCREEMDEALEKADAIAALSSAPVAGEWQEVKEIVDLFFAPWGAAKGARWEALSGDQPFNADVAMSLIEAAIVSRKGEAR